MGLDSLFPLRYDSASFDIGENKFWLPSSMLSLFICKECRSACNVSLT